MLHAIIAAGKGSRLGAGSLPKPLVDLDGRPMVRRLAEIMCSCGATRLLVAVPADTTRAEAIAAALPGIGDVPVSIVPMDTAGSLETLVRLLDGVDEPVVVATVDSVFDPAEFEAYTERFYRSTDTDALMAVTAYCDDEKPLHVAVDLFSGAITAFTDAPTDATAHVSGGIYALSPRAIATARRTLAGGATRMRDFQRALLADGLDVRAHIFSKIIDVDRPADLADAQCFARACLS